MNFIQARHYRIGRRDRIRLVVLHDMEAAESVRTAENVAAWFAGPHAPQASAHYCVDSDSIVQCVREEDEAWHAPPVNPCSIGIEHAGYARQTEAEWRDAYSTAMMLASARLVADICARHGIPVVYVDEEGLRRGESGITTHASVSRAFRKSTHTDPGKGFPLAWYLEQVQALSAPPTACE